MHSVNIDNYCVNIESNNNNSENSNDDSTVLGKREGKGKKDNAYAQPITGQ